MFDHHVGDLELKVSVKKENKNVLRPVWKKLCNTSAYPHCWEMGDVFEMAFYVRSDSYNTIGKMLRDIKQFYPEAKIDLSLYNW